MTVADNLLVACPGNATARRARSRCLALFLQLAERPGSRAWALSGGQQQMLAIGRAPRRPHASDGNGSVIPGEPPAGTP